MLQYKVTYYNDNCKLDTVSNLDPVASCMAMYKMWSCIVILIT